MPDKDMTEGIQNPQRSRMVVAILNRILALEEPYHAEVARSLGKTPGAINNQISTMLEEGWIEKEGSENERKRNFNICTEQILRDSAVYYKLRSKYLKDIEGSNIQKLFCSLLEEELRQAMRDVKVDYPSDSGNKRYDFVADWDNRAEFGGVQALIESIYQQIMAVESLIRELDLDIETAISVPDDKAQENVREYVEFLKAEEE